MKTLICSLLFLGIAVSLPATEDWTEQHVPANFDLHGVTTARLLQSNNTQRISFFVAGQGGIWRGDQPLSGEWELVLSEPGSRYRGLVELRNASFAEVQAVGDAGKVTRSFDGQTWTSSTVAAAGNFTGLSVNNALGLIVAVDDAGNIFSGGSVAGLGVRHSEPGVAWRGVAYGDNTWVVVGSDATVAISTDGNLWQIFPGALSGGLTAVDFHGIAYGGNTFQGGFFMAVGAEGFISTSTEGTIWRVRQSIQGSPRLLRSATFAARHSAWLAMGDGGVGNIIHDAATGFNVENIGRIFPQAMNGLVYSRGFTVAVGGGGRVFTSVTELNPASNELSDTPSGQISVPPEGGTFAIHLANSSQDAKWRASVESGEDFIAVTSSSGTGHVPSMFNITVDAFGTVANRSGIVFLNDIAIPVVQAGDGDPQPVLLIDLEVLTDRAILVKWPGAVGATHYEVQRRQSSNVEFTTIAMVQGAENSGGELEYVDNSGLLPNTTYCYRIIALNLVEETRVRFPGGVACNNGCSGAGNTAIFLVEFGRAQEPSPEACDTTLLTGATGFFAEIRSDFSGIDLFWNPVPDAASYLLERNDGSGFFTLNTLAGDAAAYTDEDFTDLNFSQCYTYRLTPTGGLIRTALACTTVTPPTASVTSIDIPDIGPLAGAFDLTFSRPESLAVNVERRAEPGRPWISVLFDDPNVNVIDVEVSQGIRTETWRLADPPVTRSFRVRSRGFGQANPPSEWVRLGPVSTPPPSTPADLALTGRTANSADFSWTDVATEVGYELIVRPASAIDDSQDITILRPPDATTGGVTGLFPGTTYDAFLVAVGVEGPNATSRSEQGAPSATLTFSTLPNGPFPVNAIVNGPTFISVTWGSVPGATGYEVWKSQFFAGGFTDYVLFTSTGNSVLSTSDFTVEGGHSYRYRVRAKLGPDFTSFRESNIANTPIGAPSIIEVRPLSATSMTLAWTDPNPAVQGYFIERANNNGGPFTVVKTVSGTLFDPPPLETTDTGLTPNRTYYYRVAAFQVFGNVSPPSLVVSGTTSPELRITGTTTTSITVNWDPQPGTARYFIARSDDGPTGPFIEAGAVDHPTEKFTDTGLDPSSIHHYRVFPELPGGSFGDITEIKKAVTNPLPPQSVSASLAFFAPPNAIVSWVLGSDSDTYLVQWRPEGGSFTSIATNQSFSLLPPLTSHNHFGIHPGRNEYRVRASFMGQNSSFSSIASVDFEVTGAQLWRFNHFGTVINSGDAADNSDPDADGLPNDHERAARTDPNDPNDFLRITRIEIDFPDLNVYWEGVTYDVSESTNLADFTVIPNKRRTSPGQEESASMVDWHLSPLKVYRLEVVP